MTCIETYFQFCVRLTREQLAESNSGRVFDLLGMESARAYLRSRYRRQLVKAGCCGIPTPPDGCEFYRRVVHEVAKLDHRKGGGEG